MLGRCANRARRDAPVERLSTLAMIHHAFRQAETLLRRSAGASLRKKYHVQPGAPGGLARPGTVGHHPGSKEYTMPPTIRSPSSRKEIKSAITHQLFGWRGVAGCLAYEGGVCAGTAAGAGRDFLDVFMGLMLQVSREYPATGHGSARGGRFVGRLPHQIRKEPSVARSTRCTRERTQVMCRSG